MFAPRALNAHVLHCDISLRLQPIATGQSRKWQSWEMPYYVSMTGAAVILYFGLAAKPDTDLRTWAHKQALELEEE